MVNETIRLAIAERKNAANEIVRDLMVDEKKFRQFPIVVNYNPKERSQEFVFENIDFDKLLNKQ